MLESVDVGKRAVSAYRGIAPDAILDGLLDLAERLRGTRVLHVNSTPFGGGVSELLRSLVPLMSDLGIEADWKIIRGGDDFFRVTRRIHNGLQGATSAITGEEREVYLDVSERNARLFEGEYDFVFVHDPQPAALLRSLDKGSAKWVWRCHIDTASPNPDVWRFFRPFLVDYDAAIFTMPEFVPPDFPLREVDIIPPAIDPVSPKNLALAESTARQVLDWIGIEVNKPLVTQISRFDTWKDPLGVVAAYRLARESIPGLQLALAGSMALDDPEAWGVYASIEEEVWGDPLVHVCTNLTGVGNIEVNAFQRLSDVIVQKSIREGFGLVVSEALWKGTPVVAGRAGGIPLQMAGGVGGVLVDSVEACADAIVALHEEPERAASLGRLGAERVRAHFLLPRLLLNELALMTNVLDGAPVATEVPIAGLRRDPACGLLVADDAAAPYCSDDCREATEAARRASAAARSA